jgi:hypothetical protein
MEESRRNKKNKGGRDEKMKLASPCTYSYDPTHRHKYTPK